MRTDAILYVFAGMCFGVILGWVIGTQHAKRTGTPVAATAAAAPAAAQTAQRQPPALDEARVAELRAAVEKNPSDASSVVQLANVYFDAERFQDAITWYERGLTLDPGSADASTDLGVSYYYTDRPDQALTQFERSLAIDPRHTKTMLNKGIVLAFGRQDLRGAAEEWKKVVSLAPDSAEGQAARKMLEGVAAAHASDAPAKP